MTYRVTSAYYTCGMKTYILPFIVTPLLLQAQSINAIGTTKPDYDALDEALDNAKVQAIDNYMRMHYSQIYNCLKGERFDSELDLLLLRQESLTLTPANLIVKAEFDIVEREGSKAKLYARCEEKKRHERQKKAFINAIKRLNISAGVSGWAGSFGLDAALSYRSDYGIGKIIASSVKASQSGEVGSVDSSMQTLGIEVDIFVNNSPNCVVVGIDLSVQQPKEQGIIEPATMALSYGYIYSSTTSHWEIGFILKSYNGNTINDKSMVSGGLHVRYKLF